MAQLIVGPSQLFFSADKRYLHQRWRHGVRFGLQHVYDVVQGQVRQFIGFAVDISENKELEIELQRSQTILRPSQATQAKRRWLVIDLRFHAVCPRLRSIYMKRQLTLSPQ
jgi:hypothetical protein